MTVRTTSAEAYQGMKASGRIEETTAMITAALRQHPEGLTRREIEEETGLRANQVSGRVNNLIKREIAKDKGRRHCSITGNLVNVVKLVPEDGL